MSDELIRRRAQEILSKEDLKKVETSSLLSKLRKKNSNEIVLADFSGSMDELINDTETKYQIVCELLRNLADRRIWLFASYPKEHIEGKPFPGTFGGTALGLAFEKMHEINAKHIILITDGAPDSESHALRAVQGLTIEIIYIGPDPYPDFLKRLAEATGGTFEFVNLLLPENRRKLLGKVKALLTS